MATVREGHRDTGEEGTEDESEEDSSVDTQIEAFDQEVIQKHTTDHSVSKRRNIQLIILRINPHRRILLRHN